MDRVTERRDSEQAESTEAGLSKRIETRSKDSRSTPAEETRDSVFELKDVGVAYSGNQAVRNISFDVYRNQITALIGPSGCGKSTLIRCLNRMNDLIPGATVTGEVLYHGEDMYAAQVDAVEVRKRIGMVFQKPNPFPKSIYDNIAYGPRVTAMKIDSMDDHVES